MIQIEHKAECSGCGACVEVCPFHAVTMQEDEKGFSYPKIDPAICTNCNLCKKVCERRFVKEKIIDFACAAYVKNDEIRENSSSGGVFSVLAQKVLSQNGVVVGAVLAEDGKNVRHILTESEEGITAMRGSKYLPSDVSGVFGQVKDFLRQGRQVLFTGTPCQISGLYSYLNGDDDHLITQEIICHGVASPLVWREHLSFLEKKARKNAEAIHFRNKDEGWSDFSLKVQFANGKSYRKKNCDDLFFKIYLKDFILRPSCYQCKEKGKQRKADISLADFWGVQKVFPELCDDKGVSFVWIHSEKGKALFDSVADELFVRKCESEEAITWNSAVVASSPFPPQAEHFWADYFSDDSHREKILGYYGKDPIKVRVYKWVKKMLKQ